MSFHHEGQQFSARDTDTVAAALLAAGVQVFGRSIKFHRPRSAFCLTGDCGSCLMRIDGQPNVRACQTKIAEGLRCERQNAWPSASLDVLAAADCFFPQGMDHHHLMTALRPLNQLMQRVVQELGGLGRLPDAAPTMDSLPLGQARHVSVAVVGAGPAGVAAACAVAARRPPMAKSPRDRSILLLDAAPVPGGRYLSQAPERGAHALYTAQSLGVELSPQSSVFAYYPEDISPCARNGQPGLLAVSTPQGLLTLTADRYVYATGGHPQNALFGNNDRPGVLSVRAAGLLFFHHGLHLGERPLIVGDTDEARSLVAALVSIGAKPRHIDGTSECVLEALGSPWVRAARVATRSGVEKTIACDVLIVAEPPAPAFELARLHGAAIAFAGHTGFAVQTNSVGETQVAGVFACGDVCGPLTLDEAQRQGHAVGEAVAASLDQEELR